MLIISPRIDLDGERWFSPIEGMRLLVCSSENPQYRSRNALVRRHIDKMDASFQVGTTEFDLASVGDIDSIDDLLIENASRYLLKGWEGVGEIVDGVEVPIEYSPEGGACLLKQHPELYWKVILEAASIAQGKELQTQETVKKPSKRRSG